MGQVIVEQATALLSPLRRVTDSALTRGDTRVRFLQTIAVN